ncbi:MAG TPA: hypothetical protein PKB13_01070, partial [Clostridia bacterium]|nr:hypothetical protein [Clostridia bacterium]
MADKQATINLLEAMRGFESWKKTGKTPSATSAYSPAEITALYKGFDNFKKDGSLPTFDGGKLTYKPTVDLSGLDQNVLARVKTDYQSGWADSYNVLDSVDAARRQNGYMPVSYASKYTDSDMDLYLLSQGLPSYSQFSKYYYDAENALAKEARQGEYTSSVLGAWKNLGAATNQVDDDALKTAYEAVKKKYGEDYTSGITYDDLLNALQTERQNVGAARTRGEIGRIAATNQNRYNEYQAQLAAQEAEQQRLQSYDIPAAQAEQASAKKEFSFLDWIRANSATRYPSYVDVTENTKAAKEEQAALNARSQDIRNATIAQTFAKYETQAANPDYSTFQYSSVVKPTFTDRMDAQIYDYINDRNGMREKVERGTFDGKSSSTFVPYNYMTEDERKLYNYLVVKQGTRAATEYLSALESRLNERLMQEVTQDSEAYAKNLPGLSDVSTIATNFMNPMGLVYSVSQAVKGESIDPNSIYFSPSQFTDTVRGTRGEQIEQGIGGTGGKAVSLFYQTAMSFADSIAAAAATGGATAAGAVLGLNAATAATHDAIQRGANNAQALIAGGLAGAAEFAFERIGLEELFKIPSKAARTTMLKAALGQAFIVEGGEEGLTELANVISDNLVMGSKSTYETTVSNYIAQGMTEQEARAKAGSDVAWRVASAYIGGALMGGMSGAGAYAYGKTTNARNAETAQMTEPTAVAADMATEATTGTLALPVGRDTMALNDALAEAQARASTQQSAPTLAQNAQTIATAKKVVSDGNNLYARMINALESGDDAAFQNLQDQWGLVAADYYAAGDVIRQTYAQTLPQLYDEMIDALGSGDTAAATKTRNAYYAVRRELGISDEVSAAQLQQDIYRQQAEQAQSFAAERAQDAQLTREAAQVHEVAQSIGLDQTSVQAVMDVYAQAVRSSTQAALKLGSIVKSAAAQISEVNADYAVSEAEIKADLQASYNAIQRAAQTSDYRAFELAKEAYLSKYYVAQAKIEAVRLKTSNKLKSLRNGVIEAAEGLRETVNNTIIKQKNQRNAEGGLNDGRTKIAVYSPGATNNASEIRGGQTSFAGSIVDAGTSQAGQGSQAAIEGVQRGNETREVTQAPTEEANSALQKHVSGKVTADGTPATARFVEKIPSEVREKIDKSLSIAGKNAPDVFLYDSDDAYANSFTDGKNIYLNINGDIVRDLNHELAHNVAWINAAGKSVIDAFRKKGVDIVRAYETFRAERISSPDETTIDMERELIADMYSVYSEEVDGRELMPWDGVLEEAYAEFVPTFWNAMVQGGEAMTEAVQDATTLAADIKATGDLEYSRLRMTFKVTDDGKEYGYAMPEIKKNKAGMFYADFTVDGKKMHLEDKYREDLEDEIKRLKQESVYQKASREIKQAREVMRLYKERVSVPDYYNNGGGDHEVALALRGMYMRNGLDQGGAINTPELLKLLESVPLWKELHAAQLSLTTPQRIWEDLANWRDPSQPGARAENYLEGERLKETYWGFLTDQEQASVLWYNNENEKVLAAFDGLQSTSTLAQMVGEKVITEEQAANAVYGDNGMIVRTEQGVMVFDRRGQLAALSSDGELLLFDKNYRAKQREANEAAAKAAEKRSKSQTNQEYLAGIRAAYMDAFDNAKPIRRSGNIVVENNGDTYTASVSGELLMKIEKGGKPNMENVTKLKDALVDFYTRVLPMQNGVLMENGYKPIPQRKNYLPHIRRQTHGLQDFMATLHGDAQKLPTANSGLTASYAPGKPWTSHMLERMG